MGLGVAAMHYTGMAAMRMQARLSYDLTIVGRRSWAATGGRDPAHGVAVVPI
ncbi:MAG: MHYT domain-containing protein [Thermoanaerobaculia bacterium]